MGSRTRSSAAIAALGGPERIVAEVSSPTKGVAVAIIRITQPPMLDRETYDAVNAKVGVDENPPEGLLMHSAGEVDGRFQIVDVWESAEHAERFDAERLGAGIREVIGGTGRPWPSQAPNVMSYEAYRVILPSPLQAA